jgi:hypothetical protein
MIHGNVRLLAAVAALAIASPAHADRVYRIVEYPHLQSGHTLAGTITTTNAAPADGVLTLAEILSWEWKVVGPWTSASGFTATSTDPVMDQSVVQNVSISPRAIYLEHTVFGQPYQGELRLSREWPISWGSLGHWLLWRKRSTSDSSWIDAFDARKFEGDVDRVFWLGNPNISTSARFTIATVPEPTSIVLLGLLLAVGIYSRSTFARESCFSSS